MKLRLNGESREFERPLSIAELVASLGLRPEVVAVELNGQLVPRAQHAERLVDEGDAVEVVTLVGGG